MAHDELMEELKLLMDEREAEFGIVVRRLGNPAMQPISPGGMAMRMGLGGAGQGASVEPALLAYKMFADGREELLQTVELAAVTDSVFKEIIAVSDAPTTYSYGFSPAFAGGLGVVMFAGPGFGGGNLVTVSVPDLLFEEMSLRAPTGNLPNPPIAAHPFFAGP